MNQSLDYAEPLINADPLLLTLEQAELAKRLRAQVKAMHVHYGRDSEGALTVLFKMTTDDGWNGEVPFDFGSMVERIVFKRRLG